MFLVERPVRIFGVWKQEVVSEHTKASGSPEESPKSVPQGSRTTHSSNSGVFSTWFSNSGNQDRELLFVILGAVLMLIAVLSLSLLVLLLRRHLGHGRPSVDHVEGYTVLEEVLELSAVCRSIYYLISYIAGRVVW